MEKFENEEIEPYCQDTITPTEPPRRPKRAKKSHNYKQLNEGTSSSSSPMGPMVMAMNYEESFLINVNPNIVQDEDEAAVAVDDTPVKHLKLKCLICYKSFKFHSAFSTRNHFSTNYCSKVFSTLCSLLHLQDNNNERCKWDFEFNEFPLPFCTDCSKDVIGLLRLQQLIEGYQQSILEVVYDIKAQIHETEADMSNLELLDDDNDELLNRYKEKIKMLRKSAINDFDPSSDSTKYKVFTARKTKTTRRLKQERMDEESHEKVVDKSDGFVETRSQASVPKNKTKFNLNPHVVLKRIEPDHGKKPQLNKRSSALRAKQILAAAIKPNNEDDVEEEEEDDGEKDSNMNPDPEWSENDDKGDELPKEGSESSGSSSSVEDEDETISPISDFEEPAEPDSDYEDTKKLSNSTKKMAAPKGSHKKKVTKPPKVTKQKSPFIETNDGKLLFGNIEIQKVKVEVKPEPKQSKPNPKQPRIKKVPKKVHRKRIPQLPLTTTKDGRILFGGIEIQKVKIGNELKYQCSLCGSYNKEMYAMKRHIKLGHVNRDNTASKEAKCNICGKILLNFASMSTHHKIFHSNEPRKLHQCDLCGKTFTNYSSVTRHKILEHQVPAEAVGIPLCICDICSRPLFNNKELKLHRLTHMNDHEKYLEILRLKEEDPTFILHQCTVCGKSATCAASLKTHELTHTKEKRFQCHVCCQTFAYKHALKDHLVTHQAENEIEFKFICQFPGCDKKYWRKRQLINHSYVHRPPEDKPHKCNMCESTFVRVGELRDHKRQHTGERPYVCEYCQKSFSRSNDLRKHYKNIHKITPADICQMPSMKPQLASVELFY